jgi:hypothetical protein
MKGLFLITLFSFSFSQSYGQDFPAAKTYSPIVSFHYNPAVTASNNSGSTSCFGFIAIVNYNSTEKLGVGLGGSLTKYKKGISPVVLFFDSRYRFTRTLFSNFQVGYALPVRMTGAGNINNNSPLIDTRTAEQGIYANLGAGVGITRIKKTLVSVGVSYAIQHIEAASLRTNIGYDRTGSYTLKGLQLTLSAGW